MMPLLRPFALELCQVSKAYGRAGPSRHWPRKTPNQAPSDGVRDSISIPQCEEIIKYPYNMRNTKPDRNVLFFKYVFEEE